MRLFAYLPPYKFYIFLALIAMVAAAAGSSLMALLMGKLTDLGFYQKNGLVAIWAPIALIGISVLHGGGQFCSSYLLQKVSQEILVKLRSLMFDHMIRWPEEVVQSQESGRVVSRFVNEASQALSGASQVLTVLVRDSLQVMALLCVLFWHNWQLTLVTFIVAPILIFILRTVSKRLKQLTSDSQVTFGQILSQLNETYRSERLIKVYNAYKFEEERFGHVNRRLKGFDDASADRQRSRYPGDSIGQYLRCGDCRLCGFASGSKRSALFGRVCNLHFCDAFDDARYT